MGTSYLLYLETIVTVIIVICTYALYTLNLQDLHMFVDASASVCLVLVIFQSAILYLLYLLRLREPLNFLVEVNVKNLIE